jgi:hypothetical chaperone protein
MVQQAVEKAELETSSIDRVFLTGGTSFVPVIRTVFESRFPDAVVTSSNQFDSIANGLALIGQSADIERWSVEL